MKVVQLLVLAGLLLAPPGGGPAVEAADILVTADWSATVGAEDLPSGAGSNLPDHLESPVEVAAISISNTGGASWEVWVSHAATNWPVQLALGVRRTSSGSGGSVGGGTEYVTVGPSPVLFFTGTGDVSGISIQLRLSGVSVTVPPDPAYTTTIIYEVREP